MLEKYFLLDGLSVSESTIFENVVSKFGIIIGYVGCEKRSVPKKA